MNARERLEERIAAYERSIERAALEDARLEGIIENARRRIVVNSQKRKANEEKALRVTKKLERARKKLRRME
jgi:hypothetical protein